MDEDKEAALNAAFDRLRGRLCGLIESWGLESKQERGAISTLKSLSYDSQREIAEIIDA